MSRTRRTRARWRSIVAIFVMIAGVLLPAVSSATEIPPDAAAKIEDGLRANLGASGSYLVMLDPQADLTAAAGMSRDAAGDFVYDTLRQVANESQAPVIAMLESRADVTDIRPFFIVNALQVTSGVATLDALAARADVARVRGLRTYSVPEPADNGINAVEWGVTKINADDVWAQFGTAGAGVVVANVDTGVDWDHPALINSYRGSAGSHDFAFYDPAGVCGGTVCDNNDHGSHTMGTMVGDDGGTNQIGVAPGAEWIAAKGCEGSTCTDFSLLKSAEWLLAPCAFGDAPGSPSCDPAMRPHVVNNSWGGGGGDPWYQASVNAWEASQIIPVMSAGNSGPFSGSHGSPGDYCNVISVGATDSNDVIASFSSRGPGSFAQCTAKPDVSAPGVNVRSSINGGGYANFDGTSMASPHTAGCVALLLAIDPTLSFSDVRTLLSTTGVDLGSPGFDHAYGNGRIDCLAAAQAIDGGGGDPTLDSIRMATRGITGPAYAGVRGGVVIVDETGAPVTGATVDIEWTRPDGSTTSQSGTTNTGRVGFFVTGDYGLWTLTIIDVTLGSETWTGGPTVSSSVLVNPPT